MRAVYYGGRYRVKQGLHLNTLAAAHRLLRQVFRAHSHLAKGTNYE
jgi:hypothetical protein